MHKDTHKIIQYWLFTCCGMIFAMAVIGAITRLTESGLSMVEWRPLMGALPPLNEGEWQRVYTLYQQSPEFQHKHFWMEIEDFKRIFFWEWLHRLWGRMIGLVYALPLLMFWLRGMIPSGYKLPLFGLFLLGGAQGVIGWVMVQSGLVDIPAVSHFRLALHLGMAFLLYALLFWTALSVDTKEESQKIIHSKLCIILWISLILLSITIIWGAFVAGLDAGFIYNSFPDMDGMAYPPGSPDIFNNHGWVQFTHRWLGISTGVFIFGSAIAGVRLGQGRRLFLIMAGMVVIQVGLGIATLLTQVSIPLAALHQAGALTLLSLLLLSVHKVRARLF